MPTCEITRVTSCESVEQTRRELRCAYRIDGCDVDELLQDVYRTCWDTAALRGLDLRPELIAWQPIHAAADAGALRGLLSTAVHHVACNTEEGAIHLRAFPSYDDVYVVFEVQNEKPARRRSDRLEAFTRMMHRARLEVESMGGELAEFATEDGGSRVCFRLPQWV
jgi:hypothetical protein